MRTRRKTGHCLQLEPMEGRVSLSGIGRSLPHTTPPAFGPVAPGSKPGGAGDGLVPLTSGPVAPGSNSIRYGQETKAVPAADGSNGIRFGEETNAANAGPASPSKKAREA